MAVLFIYLRRRVGEWLALAGTLPILFLGPSWDDLLFPFQVSLHRRARLRGRRAAGARLARTRRGDVIAMVLLRDRAVIAEQLAIPVRDRRDNRHRGSPASASGAPTWSPFPTVLWFAWYFGWGREAQNFISFHNFQTELGYIGDGLASSFSSLLGLAAPRDDTAISPLDWGRPLLRRGVVASRSGGSPRAGVAGHAAPALGGDRGTVDSSGR